MSGTRDKVTVTGSHSNKRDEGTTELTLLQRDDGSSSELKGFCYSFVLLFYSQKSEPSEPVKSK